MRQTKKARPSNNNACPYCKGIRQHKRACPMNPFNKTKKKLDLDGIYEFQP